MRDELEEFPKFAISVLLGLAKAAITDIDVFLLMVAALLAGSSTERLRPFGKVIVLYVIARRGDQYAALFDRQMARIYSEIGAKTIGET